MNDIESKIRDIVQNVGANLNVFDKPTCNCESILVEIRHMRPWSDAELRESVRSSKSKEQTLRIVMPKEGFQGVITPLIVQDERCLDELVSDLKLDLMLNGLSKNVEVFRSKIHTNPYPSNLLCKSVLVTVR